MLVQPMIHRTVHLQTVLPVVSIGLPSPAHPWDRWNMGDALLATTDIEEALSEAYVTAVAARAGYAAAKRNFDRDSVDLTIECGGHLRPRLDLQLKATVGLRASVDPMPFPLKVKNYNDLRIETQTPRLLVVLRLPKEPADWLTVSRSELVLRHCAYWLSLRGAPETDVGHEKTVYIPDKNRFDIEGLIALMEQSRTGTVK